MGEGHVARCTFNDVAHPNLFSWNDLDLKVTVMSLLFNYKHVLDWVVNLLGYFCVLVFFSLCV